ncbi:hypothetical protein E2C01_053003 [Portunus trituberculatus]|uniref:Uncharacterized protein n=1 Tax=Portunus trituberculatus TaxID=210409 RepID=A0A5B7GPN4_PORTR|nr:hypothetical protein [Portunus trituberculatus]
MRYNPAPSSQISTKIVYQSRLQPYTPCLALPIKGASLSTATVIFIATNRQRQSRGPQSMLGK